VTGWGLGVYNPMAWMGITAYRIGPDGAESRPWDCSYFAHTIRMQLHPGMKPYPYTIYVTGEGDWWRRRHRTMCK